MRYPNLLSRIGYYEKLLKQYNEEYPDLPKDPVIEGSLSVILQAIRSLFEKNPQEEDLEKFNKVIDYISNVSKLTEDEYNIAFKEIKPDQSVAVLYLAINKPKVVASVIQNNMKFTVEMSNMEKYFELLGKVAIRTCDELAKVNKPKLTVKTVRFSEDLVMQRKSTELKSDAMVKTSVELVGKEDLVEVNGIESNPQVTKSSTNKLK